jgi:hypothetical protein
MIRGNKKKTEEIKKEPLKAILNFHKKKNLIFYSNYNIIYSISIQKQN